MQKISPEQESEVIKYYNSGLSLNEISKKLNYGKSTISRVLFRNNVTIRSKEGYKLSEEHKRKIGERLRKVHQEWKERDPEGYRLHQQKAASKGARLGGLATHRKHPGIARELYQRAIQKHPNLASIGGLAVQKTGISKAKLLRWKFENPELAKKISSETMKKTLEKYPNLPKRNGELVMNKYPNQASRMGKITMSRYPEQASQMGKSTHQKHPNMASERLKYTHKIMKERDPVTYSRIQAEKMAAGGKKSPTRPEKIIRKLLPDDFLFCERLDCNSEELRSTVPDFMSEKRKIIIEVNGPTHYRTLGKYYDEKRLKKTQLRDKLKYKIWVNMGYQVYSFTDIEIIKEIDVVKEKLTEILLKNIFK